MDYREDAREYFKMCNLSYDVINMNDLYDLIKILNRDIAESDSFLIMIEQPIINGKNKNIIFKNGKLVFASIRVRGDYFTDREGITFNDDGFIGFVGWGDETRAMLFTSAFKEWCNKLMKKKRTSEVRENGLI